MAQGEASVATKKKSDTKKTKSKATPKAAPKAKPEVDWKAEFLEVTDRLDIMIQQVDAIRQLLTPSKK